MSPARLGGRPVDAVLFDYGLTLTTFVRPDAAIARAYGEIAALLRDRLGGAVPGGAELVVAVHDAVEAEVADHEESGLLEEMDIVAGHERAYARLGLAVPPDVLDAALLIEQRAWWEGVHVAADVPAVLTALRGAGLRLAVCSNAPYHAGGVRAQLDHLGVRPLVDAVTLSSEVGWRKPAAPIFAAALRSVGVPAERAVMVGDSVRADVMGAQRAGIAAVLLTEHRRDPLAPGGADAVLERLAGLPELLGVGPGAGPDATSRRLL